MAVKEIVVGSKSGIILVQLKSLTRFAHFTIKFSSLRGCDETEN